VVLLIVAAALLGLALMIKEPIGQALSFLDHGAEHASEHMEYANFFPHSLLIAFFNTFTGLAFLAIVIGIFRFWKAMKRADPDSGPPKKGLVASLVTSIKSILTHDKFSKCKTGKPRLMSHLGVFYGFLALFIVTIWAVAVLYVINPLIEKDLVYPFAMTNPWKILANVGALALIGGCIWMIISRLTDRDKAGTSSMFDWAFVWTLLLVGVTGLATELLRLAELETVGYTVYFIHLVFVFALLVYLPYSKFAHLAYRTTALVYAEHTGRNRELPVSTPPEPKGEGAEKKDGGA
jgi:quinone-modifying oxidoreductase subunit QmoC